MSMRNKSVKSILVLLWLILVSCKPGERLGEPGERYAEPLHIIAKKELGDKFVVEFNKPGTFVLCKNDNLPEEKENFYSLKFFVYDIAKNEIIYMDSIPRGEVFWYSDQTIKIISIPKNIFPGEPLISNTYLFDIISGEITTLGSSEIF